MDYYYNYRWCAASTCKNTSVKTPEKLFISLPSDIERRNVWLKLAKRDPESLSTKSRMYLCEDHFNLEKDMENYTRYKIMGSVKTIQMRRDCVPSKFDCQTNKKVKHKIKTELPLSKKPRNTIVKELKQHSQDKYEVPASFKDVQDEHNYNLQNISIKLEEGTPAQEQNIFFNPIKIEDEVSESIINPTMCIDVTSSDIFDGSTNNPSISTPTSDLNDFIKKEYDSDGSSRTDSVDDQFSTGLIDNVSSPAKFSVQTQTISADTTAQDEFIDINKLNLQSTLFKINKKPQLYIGLPKQLFSVIDLIKNRMNLTEEHILLCLMRIKLNRTFTELADDFDCQVGVAKHIFICNLPHILDVLSTFIKQPVTPQFICIISCLEIEVQVLNKINIIKYLITCTADGHINFVSSGYAETTTYVKMVQHSKILDMLAPSAYILADKRFRHVKQYFSQRGFTFLEASAVTRSKLPGPAKAKQIGKFRIHSKRVIHKLREFGMLKRHPVLKFDSIVVLNSCVTIACALINLQFRNENNLHVNNNFTDKNEIVGDVKIE